MGTKQEVTVLLATDNITGEHRVVIRSDPAGTVLVFNLLELVALQSAINHAITYIEKHGTHSTESVPEGAVRH